MEFEGIIVDRSQFPREIILQNIKDERLGISFLPETRFSDEVGDPMDSSLLRLGYLVKATGQPTRTSTSTSYLAAMVVQLVAKSIPIPYMNPYFKIGFFYPSSWLPEKQISTIPNPPIGFRGENGFFLVDAIGGGPELSLQGVIDSLAKDSSQRFGANPKITEASLRGQEAAFIFPSSDRPRGDFAEAVFIARYPRPIAIGSNTYYFVTLYADEVHIRDIVEKMQFLP